MNGNAATPWWQENVTAWQRGTASGASAQDAHAGRLAEAALWRALVVLGGRVAGRYGLARQAGSAAAEDVIHQTIFELFRAWARMEQAPDNPAAFAGKRFKWRVLNGLRDRPPVVPLEGGAGDGDDFQRQVAAAPWVDPVALPREVGQTLLDASRFMAVAWRMSRAGATGLPSPNADSSWHQAIAAADSWQLSAHHVLDDVRRGPMRRRWRHAGRGSGVSIAAFDNQQRAWQATYHEAEGHEGYTEATEMPASKHDKPGRAFDMHLSRFRRGYGRAARHASRVLVSATTEGAATDSDLGKIAAWSPATHPTLLAEGVANRQAARP